MKLLFNLLVAFSLAQSSFASLEYGKNIGGVSQSKINLHREPLIDGPVTFANETVDVKWIEQQVDNFDPQNEETWQMRYLENNFYLQEGGPIFIYVGGEWVVSNGSILTGHTHDMACDLNGIIFYTEHRYYGASQPTNNTSTENMKYLNIDQALADLAHFITFVKETIPEVRNSGVIMVGGSYSATMVTWFLQKYPHLVNGVWSSSAPLHAQVDFVEYKEVVSYSMDRRGGSECTARVQRAFEELERLVAAGDAPLIEEIFHLCYPLNVSNQNDVWLLFNDISEEFSGVVQYHRESFQNIQRTCNVITSYNGSDIEALSYWWWFGDSNPETHPSDYCYNHLYSSFISYYRNTDWNSGAARSAMRQWTYQTCAEYGWFQTSGSERIYFGSSFPVDLFLQMCIDLYSER